MPALEKNDVESLGLKTVEKELGDRVKRIQQIRSEAGGDLTKVEGDQTTEIRTLNGDMNLLAERRDALKELEGAGTKAEELDRFLNDPTGAPPMPKGKQGPRDAGRLFAQSDAMKAFREQGIKGQEAEVPLGSVMSRLAALDAKGYLPAGVKATLGTDSSLTNVGSQFEPESVRTGVVVEELFQQNNIADLFPQTTTTQAAVPYMVEDVVAEGAAETEEGADGSEAEIDFTEESADVRKVVVLLPVTEEALADEAMLSGHINGRLPLFVANREDRQLLVGDGVAPNLTGITNLTGVGTNESYTIGTPVEALEAVFSASVRIGEAFLTPDAATMRLAVWEQIRLATDSNGQYLIAPVTDMATPRVFGLRIVPNENNEAEAGTNTPIIVGAWAQAGQIWRRRAITLAVTDSHGTNFAAGITVVKATSRLAVTHYRPAGYELITSNV